MLKTDMGLFRDALTDYFLSCLISSARWLSRKSIADSPKTIKSRFG